MSLFFDRKTLEAIRDIIRETMLGNVAIVLLINISPDYMVQKNSPSIIMLSVFILIIICIELWMLHAPLCNKLLIRVTNKKIKTRTYNIYSLDVSYSRINYSLFHYVF